MKLGARNMSGVKLALGHAVKYAKERRQFGKAIAEFGLIKQKLAGMAIRGFVGDAMSYRTLGEVDRALESVDPSDGPRVLKTIEAFAIECSINKVWTSEALAWAVDEAVQVFGGNGYSREFPVERMFRDARITRIYEGTNEINRLIIPARLVKQSPALVTPEAAPGRARRLGRRLQAGGDRPTGQRARVPRPREAAGHRPARTGLGGVRRGVQGGAGSPGADRGHYHRGVRHRERHRASRKDDVESGPRRGHRRGCGARLHQRCGRSDRVGIA